LGNLGITLPYAYGGVSTAYKYVVRMPDVSLPALAEPLRFASAIAPASSGYGFSKTSATTPSISDGVFQAEFSGRFIKAALMFEHQDSSSNPQISWLPLKQIEANSGTVTSLEIYDTGTSSSLAAARWIIHGPAGMRQVNLPTPPAGIMDLVLPNSLYRMRLSTYAIENMGYQDLLLNHSAQKLPLDQNYEGLSIGGSMTNSINLLR
jgi:hypothetical protein